jgi:NitT/TauT family transport system permease protein
VAADVTRGRAVAALAWLVALSALFTLWEMAARNHVVNAFLFGQPTEIGARLHDWVADGSLWSNALITFAEVAAGFSAATVAGVLIGVWLGSSPVARQIVSPFLVFFNAVPRLILGPFFVIWLGFGLAPKIVFVVFVIVFIVVINVMSGMREVPRELVSHVRALGGGRRDVVTRVFLPSIAFWLVASARSTAGYAFSAAIIAEFVGSNHGLGYLLSAGQSRLDVNTTWAALAVVMVAAIVVDRGLARVHKRITPWLRVA